MNNQWFCFSEIRWGDDYQKKRLAYEENKRKEKEKKRWKKLKKSRYVDIESKYLGMMTEEEKTAYLEGKEV